MKLKNAAVIAVILILAGISLYKQGMSKERETEGVVTAGTSPQIGAAAPAFELKGMDGGVYRVGGPREKPLWLNFWASWCPPCKEEAPELVKLYAKYKDKIDLYAVNLTGNDDYEQARAFAAEYGFSFPVLLDHTLRAAQLYRFQVIPTSFLIDRNGNVVDMFNYLEPEELDKRVGNLAGS